MIYSLDRHVGFLSPIEAIKSPKHHRPKRPNERRMVNDFLGGGGYRVRDKAIAANNDDNKQSQASGHAAKIAALKSLSHLGTGHRKYRKQSKTTPCNRERCQQQQEAASCCQQSCHPKSNIDKVSHMLRDLP